MTDANRQFSLERSAHPGAMVSVAAGLLVLLGMVFQLGELGYGPCVRITFGFSQ